MKSIDFSRPGGFPLTQEKLAYLQNSWQEMIVALVSTCDSGGAPVLITGMGIGVAGGTTYNVNDGWLFYGGELIRFVGAYGVEITDTPIVVITRNSTPAPQPYFSGITPNVINESTATLVDGPNVTDADHFRLDALINWTVIDTVTAAAVTILTGQVNTLLPWNNAWVAGGAPTITTVGSGGSLTGYTVTYNKYKAIGKTMYWQLNITGAVVAGLVNTIDIQAPPAIYTGGSTWANLNSYQSGVVNAQWTEVRLIDLGGGPCIRIFPPAGPPFAVGAYSFSINIIAEIA